MAKKRRRRRTSLLTKAINLLTLGIALSPILTNLGGTISNPQRLVDLYSAGLSRGSFNKELAIRAYGPLLAAILFRKGVSMVRKVAHV